MNYLTLERVTKTYGEKVLFKDISLFIDKGQKIALVAKNGTGKTTLMRVLSGEEGAEGENAKIIISKEIRTGFLHQEPILNDEATALEAMFESQNPSIQAIKAYEVALLHPEREEDMHAALTLIDDLKAWDFEAGVNEILSRLRIDQYLEQKVGSLSGGQKKRLALAKLLIDEPDFIILDEPTNHLDLDMIEWLEEYLSKSSLTIFMVTHDRYFLDAVCNTIIELEDGQFYRYKGNYGDYLDKKALRQEADAATMEKNRQLFKRELEWMRRMPQARTTKAKSRIDEFYDIKEKVSKRSDNTDMQIEIKTTWLGSKILELHNVSKAYNRGPLVKDFSYKFKRRERVGIVGPNGTGKSTLLQMMTGLVQPDAGKVVIGETTLFGYYTQSGMQLKEDKRVIDVITDVAEYIPLEKGFKITAAALLERFLFSRSQQQVYVSQLSGGEKRRLYLLTVIMKNPNFLILDEPTNDLDIMTLNVLEEFLEDYNGCLVIVTHDRYFMDKLVDHLFIFEGKGEILDYNGNYSEYREEKKAEARAGNAKNAAAKAVVATGKSQAAGNAAAPEKGAAPSVGRFDKKELGKLEKEIARLEKRKEEITTMFDNSALKPDEIRKLSVELGQVSHSLEEKELKWLDISQ